MKKAKAQAIVRQMRQIYNTIAPEWDVSRAGPSGVKMKVINGVKKGMTVLDLGFGNGLMTGAVMVKGATYIGIDISSKFTAMCRRRFASYIKTGQAKFITANALKLPFKNNSFDFIFSFAVMHHVPSEELRIQFLKEVYRVLKPGAIAKIDSWNLLEDWGRKKFDIKKQLKNIPSGHDKGDVYISWRATANKDYPRYIHLFSDVELKELARTSGFKKIKIEYFNRAGVKTKNGEAQVLTVKK